MTEIGKITNKTIMLIILRFVCQIMLFSNKLRVKNASKQYNSKQIESGIKSLKTAFETYAR